MYKVVSSYLKPILCGKGAVYLIASYSVTISTAHA